MRRILFILSLFSNSFIQAQQVIPYASAPGAWNADSLGNHRAVLNFTGEGQYARANFYWRRRDDQPELKRIIVQDAQTGLRIMNTKYLANNNEWCDILFEPTSGKGTYYLYYMPSHNEGRSNYPKGTYWKPDTTSAAAWINGISNGLAVNTTAVQMQSIDVFNSFDPMEIIATGKETSDLIARSKRKDILIFPEVREFPIRMSDRLPYRWVRSGPQETFSASVARGEHFTFQLGLYALTQVKGLTVSMGTLTAKNGRSIRPDRLTCFNTHGIDYTGKPFDKTIDVVSGQVQAIWCGVEVPIDIPRGDYTGFVTVKPSNAPPVKVSVTLKVEERILADGGISDPARQTRLHWLNSILAQDNTVIAPYTPLRMTGNTIDLLGRKLTIGKDGLPAMIQTFFTPEMTGMVSTPNDVLAAPMRFRIEDEGGRQLQIAPLTSMSTSKSDGTISWSVKNGNDAVRMDVSAKLEFDGFLTYRIKVVALKDISLKDIALDIPFTASAATYMMGLGRKGGMRPGTVDWHWKVDSANQDGAWIGSVNAGLQYSLRDERYSRPLNTNFYLQKPLLLPTSWGNGNKGGILIREAENAVVATNYSGARRMAKGDSLFYDLTLLITPFHTLNTDFQWANRFYHKYDRLDSIKEKGATLINIHHATPINPWINYPFIEWNKMKGYIDSAHAMGLKVKIYNTVRELSNHAYETFPMRSLGHEIYSPGKGGGFSWLQEHVGKDYIAAWFVPEIKDAAIVNSGMSRWHNYYVEGMNWLTQQVGIDGIYLDDVAFDRVTMKRIKRVLTKDGHPGIIDLHSANQFNKNDGFNNSANLYMEHFPYLNRLWFGEYFDYEKNGPDFFLTEVSGIPFGLMGEMLEGGGNPWRGMVYGMTNRMPWSGQTGPGAIWKVWDDFGMTGTEMIGYWSPRCPVRTDKEAVKATVYRKAGKALVSLASWEPQDTDFNLQVDWKALGIDPTIATIVAPKIEGFQEAKTFRAGETIPVGKGMGWILVIQ